MNDWLLRQAIKRDDLIIVKHLVSKWMLKENDYELLKLAINSGSVKVFKYLQKLI